MKSGWVVKKLGDLFDITSSKRVFESDWKREGVPFYRAREIVKLAKQGFVENELFISEEMFSRYSTNYGIPAAGDIMVTGVGTLGVCYVVQTHDRFYFKDGNIIWLKKKSEAESRFIEYAFQSDFLRKQIDDSVGATVGTYTIVKAKHTQIPFPPIPEQQRIVGILDEAFEGIAAAKTNAERNLQNGRAIFDSLLRSAFNVRNNGWPIKKLGQVSDLITDGTHNSPPYVEVGIPMLDSKHVRDGFLIDDTAPEKFISPATDALLAKRCKPQKGDILVSSRGSIGKIAIVRDEQDFNIMGNIILIRLSPGISREFTAFYLLSQVSHIESIARGVAQKGLYLNQVREYGLPLPSETQQVKIGKQLNVVSAETRQLESFYQRKLDALEALKKSLLHQAFTGNL